MMVFSVGTPSAQGGQQSVIVLIIIALCAGGAAQVAWEAYKYFRGGQRRKERAEAAEAAMKISSDTEQAPLVRESLALGNFDQAISIQQQVINGLNAQIERDRNSFDAAIASRDKEISDLRLAMRSRDDRIDELEKELEAIKGRMETCQQIIKSLREDHDAEQAERRANES